MSNNSVESLHPLEQRPDLSDLFRRYSKLILDVITGIDTSKVESVPMEQPLETYTQSAVTLEVQFSPSFPAEKLRVRGKKFVFGRKRDSVSQGRATFFYYSVTGKNQTLRICTEGKRIESVDLLTPTTMASHKS